MIFLTADQMKEVDRYTIEEIGIPSIVLMENAKAAISAKILARDFDTCHIFAATGNNGGDGLAVARDIYVADKKVKVYVIGNPEKASKDFMTNYKILKNLGVDITLAEEGMDFDIKEDDVVVDAIFGTGLKRDIRGLHREVIEKLNGKKAYKLAIDMPSGLDSDDGSIHGILFDSDLVVTLQCPKVGLKDFDGVYVVEPIGIPQLSIDRVLKK
ncbi:MAG: NAD(P)H-hydrate epimerase [Finegoldia sp.]|nr:NAD(P)H-hydrate epimerase [Finegoldia sp.]